jgi:hypothetical protein
LAPHNVLFNSPLTSLATHRFEIYPKRHIQ